MQMMIVALGVALLFCAPLLQATSFDCSKAKLDAEKTICEDQELSLLDDAMAQAFKEALQKGNDVRALQKTWLKERNACGADVACLLKVYEARIPQLLGESSSWRLPDWQKAKGKWTEIHTSDMGGQYLTINHVTAQGVHFHLEALSGGHTGEIEGDARFTPQGNALFISEEESDDERCQVRLAPYGLDRLYVTTRNCSAYGGMGVAFGGQFVHKVVKQSLSLVDLEVLTPKEDQIFRQLVGRAYADFAQRFQLRMDGQDIDGLNTRVIQGAVRGMFTVMEAIVMISPHGKCYAAMLHDGKVEYFSNDPQYARRLPRTIDAWRKNFTDAPVAFMTGKSQKIH